MKRQLMVALAGAVLLTGCLGDDYDWGEFAVMGGPASGSADTGAVIPLSVMLSHASMYQVRIEGAISCEGAGPVTTGVHLSLSGNAQIRFGDAYPDYELSTCPQTVQIKQTVTIEMFGAGPWMAQVLVLPKSGSATIGYSNLTISAREPI